MTLISLVDELKLIIFDTEFIIVASFFFIKLLKQNKVKNDTP